MPVSTIESLRIKAKLLQKSKARAGNPVALKDAYALIAHTAGYQSWQEMKAIVEAHEILRPKNFSLTTTWYSNYSEGKSHILANGGYLIPYQKQYFVCEESYLSALGLDLSDADIEKVGHDWTSPLDGAAYERILKKIRAVREAK